MLANKPEAFEEKSSELKSAAMAIGATNMVILVDKYKENRM